MQILSEHIGAISLIARQIPWLLLVDPNATIRESDSQSEQPIYPIPR